MKKIIILMITALFISACTRTELSVNLIENFVDIPPTREAELLGSSMNSQIDLWDYTFIYDVVGLGGYNMKQLSIPEPSYIQDALLKMNPNAYVVVFRKEETSNYGMNYEYTCRVDMNAISPDLLIQVIEGIDIILLVEQDDEESTFITTLGKFVSFGEPFIDSTAENQTKQLEETTMPIPNLIIEGQEGQKLSFFALYEGDFDFRQIMLLDLYEDIYMPLGQTVKMVFNEDMQPNTIVVEEILLDEDGTSKFKNNNIKTIQIAETGNGFTFDISGNLNIGQSQSIEDFKSRASLKGYRVTCDFEERLPITYGFIIRSDPFTDMSQGSDHNQQLNLANMVVNRLAYALYYEDIDVMMELLPYLDTDADSQSDIQMIFKDMAQYMSGASIEAVVHRFGNFIDDASVVYELVLSEGLGVQIHYQPPFDQPKLFEIIIRRSIASHDLMDAYVEAIKVGDLETIAQITFVDGEQGKTYSEDWIAFVVNRYQENFELEQLNWYFTGKILEGGIYECLITDDKTAEPHPIRFSRFYENLSIVDTWFNDYENSDTASDLSEEDFVLTMPEGTIQCREFPEDLSLGGRLGQLLATNFKYGHYDYGYDILWASYEFGEISYYSLEENKHWITSIEITHSEVMTSRGIGVGDSLEDLWSVYSVKQLHFDYQSGYYGYSQNGYYSIHFTITDDVITSIGLYYWFD